MAVAMGDVTKSSVTFDVSLDTERSSFVMPPSPKIPPKFAERLNRRKRAYTTEQLDDKLKQAEKRRKEQETARLDRIHDRQKHCTLMAQKMAMLMEQDAKRRGEPGTENIPAMSSRQASAMIKSVANDFQMIGIGLTQDPNLSTS